MDEDNKDRHKIYKWSKVGKYSEHIRFLAEYKKSVLNQMTRYRCRLIQNCRMIQISSYAILDEEIVRGKVF